jgi:hypothetical protein
MDLTQDSRLNHRFLVESGVEAEACGALLRAFFQARRGRVENGPEEAFALGDGGEIG